MRLILISGLLLLLLSGCSRSHDYTLARRGIIDDNAPVKAVVRIVIDAPAQWVWDVIANIKDWPKWQPDIKAVSIQHKPAAGVSFEWSTGAGSIHSRLAQVEPPRQLSWTGQLLIFHAIHTWTLTSLPRGQTLVQIRESMGGWPISLFYSSKDLLSSDRQWLVDLKQETES